jgi:hypothetical protein
MRAADFAFDTRGIPAAYVGARDRDTPAAPKRKYSIVDPSTDDPLRLILHADPSSLDLVTGGDFPT